ncbi:MAG: hypothetical protein JWQ70_317, partial [Aeromicrobium sp.]|nr:hypothetical protein [Aeromicrobium sp.]
MQIVIRSVTESLGRTLRAVSA